MARPVPAVWERSVIEKSCGERDQESFWLSITTLNWVFAFLAQNGVHCFCLLASPENSGARASGMPAPGGLLPRRSNVPARSTHKRDYQVNSVASSSIVDDVQYEFELCPLPGGTCRDNPDAVMHGHFLLRRVEIIIVARTAHTGSRVIWNQQLRHGLKIFKGVHVAAEPGGLLIQCGFGIRVAVCASTITYSAAPRTSPVTGSWLGMVPATQSTPGRDT